jgi:hypothetical protein
MRDEPDRDQHEADDEEDEAEEGSERDSRPPAARRHSRQRRRKVAQSDPADAEDDLDEDEDERDYRPVPRRAKERARRGPAKRRRQPRPRRPSEAEINSPRKQTIYLLGVVAGATVLMWGAGKFACNAHPPQSMQPRVATLNRLARTPKAAAIELQQRLATFEYSGALELSKGELHQEVMAGLKKCEAELGACDANRERVAGKVISMGEVLSRGGRQAKVRVRTTIDGKTTSYLVELEADGGLWRAVKRTREAS